MSTLAHQFLALSPGQKRTVHFVLCKYALGKWLEYVAPRGQVRYIETVCGTKQVVDNNLPKEAFESAQSGRDLGNVDERYGEPIAAMQDDDLAFPEPVKFAYYAIHNLFLKYARHEAIDDWLIVNQAVSSETDESKWESLLEEAITAAIA